MSEEKNKYPIIRDVAEQELDRFFEMMEIDLDLETKGPEERGIFEGEKERLIKAIMLGRLVINEEGLAEYTTTSGDLLTFQEPDGAANMAMDRAKSGESFSKMYKAIAAITETSTATFSKMKRRDLKVCEAIFLFYQ